LTSFILEHFAVFNEWGVHWETVGPLGSEDTQGVWEDIALAGVEFEASYCLVTPPFEEEIASGSDMDIAGILEYKIILMKEVYAYA
jgi:hypothetical protein